MHVNKTGLVTFVLYQLLNSYVATCGETKNVGIKYNIPIDVQGLHLSEWQLVAMVVSAVDDDYDDNYLKVQVNVLPAAMEEQEYRKATDVSEVVSYTVLLHRGLNLMTMVF